MRTGMALGVAVATLLAPHAAAAGDAARLLPWLALTGDVAAPSGRVRTAYAPTLSGGGLRSSSHAGQTLELDAARSPGIEAGLAVFPARHLGLQVLGSYGRSELGGVNTPYDIHLSYTARPPPSLEPRELTLDDAVDWPDTTGTLRRLTVALGAVARFGAGRFEGRVSAGLAYHRLGGEAESLGYTAFNLGGHSVVFSNESHLAFTVEDAGGFGVHLGAQAEIALGERAALLLGMRYLGGGDVDLPVRLERIVNLDEVLRVEPVSDIQAALQPTPARISPGTVQIVLGVTLRR